MLYDGPAENEYYLGYSPSRPSTRPLPLPALPYCQCCALLPHDLSGDWVGHRECHSLPD